MATNPGTTATAPRATRRASPSEAVAQPPTSRVETEVWSGSPSQIVNLGGFIMCTLLCWLVIPIFVAFWRYLLVRSMRYELTTQRFRVTYGVLARTTEELELYRVKDSEFSQTLFQRLFGLGTIAMATSDESTPLALIACIPAGRAKELREQIRNLVEELRDRKRVREIDYA